mgnify:CR=1 FL=1
MAAKLNKNKIGLTLGLFMGLMHAVWAVMVSMGLGQKMLDMVYRVHFLNNPFVVSPFIATRAVKLIVFTALMGYVVGFVFAFVWNRGRGRD